MDTGLTVIITLVLIGILGLIYYPLFSLGVIF